jgi:hypothetical protein
MGLRVIFFCFWGWGFSGIIIFDFLNGCLSNLSLTSHGLTSCLTSLRYCRHFKNLFECLKKFFVIGLSLKNSWPVLLAGSLANQSPMAPIKQILISPQNFQANRVFVFISNSIEFPKIPIRLS